MERDLYLENYEYLLTHESTDCLGDPFSISSIERCFLFFCLYNSVKSSSMLFFFISVCHQVRRRICSEYHRKYKQKNDHVEFFLACGRLTAVRLRETEIGWAGLINRRKLHSCGTASLHYARKESRRKSHPSSSGCTVPSLILALYRILYIEACDAPLTGWL